MRNAYEILYGKDESNRSLERYRHISKDNVKIDLRNTKCGC
jgi:hypothetical protein